MMTQGIQPTPKRRALLKQLLQKKGVKIADARIPRRTWTPLVEIQPGGPGQPIFFLHNQSAAMNLAHELGTYWPVFGMEPSGLEGDTEFDTSIEQMAERYIKALKTVQPSGPYRLAGYCAGGVVAYEMACRLEAEGQRVSLVVELDGDFSRYMEHSWLYWFVTLKESFPFWVQEYILGKGFSNTILRIKKKLQKCRAILKGEKLRRDFNFPNLGYSDAFMERLQQHMELQLIALKAYRPQPYSGRVTVFSAKWKYPTQVFFTPADPTLGWKKLARGGVDVHSFEGEHISFYQPPHLSAVVSALKEILEKLDKEEQI